MALTNTVGKALLQASPLGGALNAARGVLGALGLGKKPPQWRQSATYDEYVSMRDRARAGDRVALDRLAVLSGRDGIAKGLGSKFKEIRDKAANAYTTISAELAGGAKFSPTTAPVAFSGNRPVSLVPLVVPALLNVLRPCAFGPRMPNGRCPSRGSSLFQGRASTGRPKAPCRWGPRTADGRCPTKSDYAATSTLTKIPGQVGRNFATTGLRSVVKAVGKGGVGGLVKVVAKASLIGAAGIAAYYLTSKLLSLRYKTYDDLRLAAANAYREARQQTPNGVPLTPLELMQLGKYFKSRLALLNTQEAAGEPITSANVTFED